MSKENPDCSSDETDEELLEIEKRASRLDSRGMWVATFRAVEDLLANDEDSSLAITSLDIPDKNNPDGKENPRSTTPTPETSSSNKPNGPEEDITEDKETEDRTLVSTKKVRFSEADETITLSDDGTSQELEYARSPKSYRLLKDIKIDLSKLIPATARFGRRDESQTQTTPSSSPELSFPEMSCSRPSFEDLAAIPGPSYEDPLISRFSSTGRHCIPFLNKNIKPHTRQFNTSSDDDESSEEPTESRRLLESKNLNLSAKNRDKFEWDFTDSPIKSLTVSDKSTALQCKVKLNDDDMPHIYDPKTNLYIPLNNGDKIEVVADIHPVPKQFRTVPESTTTSEKPQYEPKLLDLSVKDKSKNRKQEEDINRIDVVPTEDDDQGSLILQLPDEDFDESMAPDNPDWSEPPSPTFPERRHSI